MFGARAKGVGLGTDGRDTSRLSFGVTRRLHSLFYSIQHLLASRTTWRSIIIFL